jgi:uncharacterized flavoprotein (TIGR03862 family)
MAAEVAARGGASVTVYERMPTVGRKFLLAGRGGLNLTHSEALALLMQRYGPAEPRLRAAVEAFSPDALRAWCENLGQPTFIGSSGRVFPKSMKTSPLLRAWLRRLVASGVQFKLRHRWKGWDDAGRPVFATPEGDVAVEAGASVFALGGASWPQLGSDGTWVDVLSHAGIAVAPLYPTNCGVRVAWSEVFRSRFAGHPLKRLSLSIGGRHVRGEAVVTETGLEGGGVYALSTQLREAMVGSGEAHLGLDLRPDATQEELAARLGAPRGKQSLANHLRKSISLPPVAVGLLHEAALGSGQRLAAMTAAELAGLIKAVLLRVTGLAPMTRAISTAGGVAFDAVDDTFMLRQRPGVFVAGEMLDWEAPTGGYLLQACFATGAAAAEGALAYFAGKRAE